MEKEKLNKKFLAGSCFFQSCSDAYIFEEGKKRTNSGSNL